MRISHQVISVSLLLLVSTVVGCGSGGVGDVRGQVTVDGAPAETGTITFKPADNPTGRGVGGALNAGQFEVPNSELKPGKYLVAVQALKSTGKTFKHPHKGEIAVKQPVTLANSPQEIEITTDNAHQLQIGFSTKSK